MAGMCLSVQANFNADQFLITLNSWTFPEFDTKQRHFSLLVLQRTPIALTTTSEFA